MKQCLQKIFLGWLFLCASTVFSQDISLLQQFNGRYDFLFFGNTLNPQENSFQFFPYIYTASSSFLSLNPNDEIEKAYLYWAGCGTGDFEVKLNDQIITPDRTFSHQRPTDGFLFNYFSAFKDVTDQVKATGNGLYTLSDLDVTPFINYSFYNRTNFAGWAIIVIYKNQLLPLNQLNVYDGLQAVPDEINITLNSLKVIDNTDAKIGFLAWEGDSGIAVNETLTINGNPISNPPLNPVNNAFNGTNSFNNSSLLYNMDMDSYSIQNNIKIGDTSANIKLTSGQDFVMINAIVTKLNSQLPDATIQIKKVSMNCDSRTVLVDYSVSNLNATSLLPANTSISFYADNNLLQTLVTDSEIAINETKSYQIAIDIPSNLSDDFKLTLAVDDEGTGLGKVAEIIENNNRSELAILLPKSPLFNSLENKVVCNEGLGKGTFDFSNYEYLVKTNASDEVHFYETLENAQNKTEPIFNSSNYIALNTPKTIFVCIENEFCSSITSFELITTNCQPTIYNFISANNDGINDSFKIEGLKDIFLNYKIEIYNRWGRLVWEGNNTTSDWNGHANKGNIIGKGPVPFGTYYYILYLNDPDYHQPIVGYIFLTY
ncbi:gliding motility-associated C-terminal domain-containing protein [Flavobacterium faecale]|uniref:gliding motility-associated C-terminal domain-containing protein n=1 Tax=Flavobacterium faecale TaxID=1355330 RepID=UPI003AACF547